MKLNFTLFIFLSCYFYSNTTDAQLRITGGTGVSGFMGDLQTERVPVFKSVSANFSLGATYDLQQQLRARLNLSIMGLQADDKNSSKVDRQARNLNFKSSVWEAAVMAEYDFMDRDIYNIVPYVFGGIGVFHFNPYTYDSIVGKVYLHDVGTSGQYLGLSGYPQPYKRTAIDLPIGLGIRYEVSESMAIGFELNYRILFTDWVDDVSTAAYVDPTLFYQSSYYTANNNYYADLASRLSYRGTPKYSRSLNRGSTASKDAFYSFQITLAIKLDGISFGGGNPFSGASYNRSRHYTY